MNAAVAGNDGAGGGGSTGDSCTATGGANDGSANDGSANDGSRNDGSTNDGSAAKAAALGNVGAAGSNGFASALAIGLVTLGFPIDVCGSQPEATGGRGVSIHWAVGARSSGAVWVNGEPSRPGGSATLGSSGTTNGARSRFAASAESIEAVVAIVGIVGCSTKPGVGALFGVKSAGGVAL
jgi:hypothetical protein